MKSRSKGKKRADLFDSIDESIIHSGRLKVKPIWGNRRKQIRTLKRRAEIARAEIRETPFCEERFFSPPSPPRSRSLHLINVSVVCLFGETLKI